MEERVKSIGGIMVVSSSKGEGFTVNITIPVGIKTGGNQHE
jgi:signal transduction histidine kinase